jgi:hypothetical protein
MGFQQFGKGPAEFKPHALNILEVSYLGHFLVPPESIPPIVKKIHNYFNQAIVAEAQPRQQSPAEIAGLVAIFLKGRTGRPWAKPRVGSAERSATHATREIA